MSIRCPECRNSVDVPDVVEAMNCTCPECHTTFRVEGAPRPIEGGNSALVTVDVDGERQRHFGRFRILREIGRGGFGTVYKAVHIDLGLTVALKIPRSGELATEDEKQRFYKEGRKAALLDHPTIVPTFDAGEFSGTPYIVSKYVDGTTLANFKDIRPLSYRESAQLVATVADALHYAHDQGLIHRDVKPQNLMVDRGLSPLLMDFGLAKHIGPGITVSSDGGVVGTPAYMSPEQAEGETDKIDCRTDVFSLGVVLYELLTRQLPFQGRHQQVIDQIRFTEPRPPRSIDSGIPKELETICMKAMAKEPDLRYQSAAELADDLRRWLERRPIQARPISRLGRAWRWCRRNALVASLLGMFTISMLAGTSVSTALYLEAAAQRDAKDAVAFENQEHSSRIHVAEANLNTTDDLMTSAAHLAEALQCDVDNEQRAPLSRLRLATTLDRCPSLEQTWWHDDELTHVTCSPDGRLVLTTSADRSARVWDRASAAAVMPALNHNGVVTHGAFSPDGRHIVTACQDGTAFVWDAVTGEQVARLDHGKAAADRPNPQQVHWACIRNHCLGADVAVLTVSVGAAFVWDGLTGRKIYTVPCRVGPGNVCFDPTGRCVAFNCDSGIRVVLTEGNTEPTVENLRQDSLVHDLAFSATGMLATACEDGNIRLWDLDDLRARTKVKHPGGPVHKIEFSADGRLLAAADAAGGVAVYSVGAGGARLSQIGTAKRPQPVTELAFDRGGYRLTAVSEDRVRVWNVDADQRTLALHATITHPDQVRHAEPIDWNGSVAILTACADGAARIWQLPREQLVFRLPKQGRPFENVAFDHRGGRFVAASRRSAPTADVCDVNAAGVSEAWHIDDKQGDVRHKGAIKFADMSADGRFVVTGGVDNHSIVWSVAERQAVAGPFDHGQIVHSVSFHRDARFVLSMNLSDENIRVWDVSGGQIFKHDGPVRAAVFSPTEPVLAIGEGRTVTFRDLESHQLLEAVLEHESAVSSCIFSPDGSHLVVLGEETAHIWNWRNATSVGQVLRHARLLRGVVYNDGGTRILTFGDHQARVWDASDGTPTGDFVEIPQRIEIGALSPDGHIACTATSGGKLYIWDVLTGEPVAPAVEHGEALLAARFIGQNRLLTVTQTGLVRSIALSTADSNDRLYERVELLTGRRLK